MKKNTKKTLLFAALFLVFILSASIFAFADGSADGGATLDSTGENLIFEGASYPILGKYGEASFSKTTDSALLGGDGFLIFSPTKGELTFIGINISASTDFAISVDGSCKLRLIGENVINMNSAEGARNRYGIYANGNLSVFADGKSSLSIIGGNQPESVSVGIAAESVSFESGECRISDGAGVSIGITTFDGGDVKISEGARFSYSGGCAFYITNGRLFADGVLDLSTKKSGYIFGDAFMLNTSAASELPIFGNGLKNALIINTHGVDMSNASFDIMIRGTVFLEEDFKPLSIFGRSYSDDVTLRIPTGSALVITEGATLDLSALAPGNVMVSGEIVPFGTLTCSHVGGEATCAALAICDICKTGYGTKPPHTLTDGVCSICDTPCPHEGAVGGYCDVCELSLYPIYVGGVRITEKNLSDVLRDGSVSYDPTSKTLTLSEADIQGIKSNFGAAIYSEDDLNIILIGENRATAYSPKYGELNEISAIFILGSLTVSAKANASLHATAHGGNSACAISALSGFTQNSGKVTASANAPSLALSIYSDSDISIIFGECVLLAHSDGGTSQALSKAPKLDSYDPCDVFYGNDESSAVRFKADSGIALETFSYVRIAAHECFDENGDHACDLCPNAAPCTDLDKDHVCDGCKAPFGVHEPTADAHECAWCGLPASDCSDENSDHRCDLCRTELAHDFSAAFKKDGGHHWHECSCGKRGGVSEHSFGEWVVTEEPTGFAPGTKTKTCVCGEFRTAIVPAADGAPIPDVFIALIAFGAAIVIALGVFSFVWFVIKKKSFSDIMSHFRSK